MAEMTPRDRVLALINGEKPDRIPTDYWATPEFDARFKADLGCEDTEALYRRLHIDGVCNVDPRPLREHHPDDPEADMWGVRHTVVEYGTGTYNEVSYHPLAAATTVQEIHDFHWPSADDYDYGMIPQAIEQNDGYRAVRAGSYEPFLRYGALRGLEQSFEDLIVNPDIADAILEHLYDFCFELNRRIYEAGKGKIDITYIAEDLGSQTGPLMSLEHYRRYLLDNQKKMADLVRSYGIHVFFHTDGSSYPFLGDLVDVVGIEVLNPIQWRCPGMERERLVRDFGDRIAFHGSIDNQQTLPFGTVQDVETEVRESVEIYRDARWICAPCHNIQAVSPTENILAMYETLHELGGQ